MKILLTDAACLINYVNSIVADIKYEIDEPLKLNFSKKATKTISRIRAEDIETSYNPDGIQGIVNIGGIIESTKPMRLKKLKFEDFMSEDRT